MLFYNTTWTVVKNLSYQAKDMVRFTWTCTAPAMLLFYTHKSTDR